MEARTIKTSGGTLSIDTEPGNKDRPIRVTLKAGIFGTTVFMTEEQAREIEDALITARYELMHPGEKVLGIAKSVVRDRRVERAS